MATAQVELIDSIAAVVEGHVIMQSDVQAVVELGLAEDSASADDALTHLIERQLVLAQADRYGVPEPSSAAVDQQLAAVRARFADNAAFEQILSRVGLSFPDLRQILSDDLRLAAYLDLRFGSQGNRRAEALSVWLDDLQRRAHIVRPPAPASPSAASGR